MDARTLLKIIKDKQLTPQERINQLKEFIQNLNDPKILDMPYEGDTALTAAVRKKEPDCASALIEAKADVNAKPEDCLLSPLHFAAYHGRADCIKLLLEAKVNLDEKDRGGNTALGYATGLIAKCGKQKETVCLLLAAGAELNLEANNDSSVRSVYKILSEGDHKDLPIKLAFEALLRMNEKVKIKDKGREANSFMFMRRTLSNEELKIIDDILKKLTDQVENKNTNDSWCLTM